MAKKWSSTRAWRRAQKKRLQEQAAREKREKLLRPHFTFPYRGIAIDVHLVRQWPGRAELHFGFFRYETDRNGKPTKKRPLHGDLPLIDGAGRLAKAFRNSRTFRCHTWRPKPKHKWELAFMEELGDPDQELPFGNVMVLVYDTRWGSRNREVYFFGRETFLENKKKFIPIVPETALQEDFFQAVLGLEDLGYGSKQGFYEMRRSNDNSRLPCRWE